MVNHKKTGMVKDGEDSQGLQTTNFQTFQDMPIVTQLLY